MLKKGRMTNNHKFGSKSTYPSSQFSEHDLLEDYFQVEVDLTDLESTKQFTQITFGIERNWVKFEKSERWLINALQFMLIYIISDPQQRVTFSSQNFTEPSQTRKYFKNIAKTEFISLLQKRICMKNSNKDIKRQINMFFEWLLSVSQYYKQQKAKLNIICTKLSQKPHIHYSIVSFLEECFGFKHHTFQQNLSLQQGTHKIIDFSEFNQSLEETGLEIKGVADSKCLKIVTNRIDGAGYCMLIRNIGGQYMRIGLTNNQNQYRQTLMQMGCQHLYYEQKMLFSNSTFMCQEESDQHKQKTNKKIVKLIKTEEQDLNQSIEFENQLNWPGEDDEKQQIVQSQNCSANYKATKEIDYREDKFYQNSMILQCSNFSTNNWEHNRIPSRLQSQQSHSSLKVNKEDLFPRKYIPMHPHSKISNDYPLTSTPIHSTFRSNIFVYRPNSQYPNLKPVMNQFVNPVNFPISTASKHRPTVNFTYTSPANISKKF